MSKAQSLYHLSHIWCCENSVWVGSRHFQKSVAIKSNFVKRRRRNRSPDAHAKSFPRIPVTRSKWNRSVGILAKYFAPHKPISKEITLSGTRGSRVQEGGAENGRSACSTNVHKLQVSTNANGNEATTLPLRQGEYGEAGRGYDHKTARPRRGAALPANDPPSPETDDKLKAAYDYWLKANARLKSMGIYELSLPDILRPLQNSIEIDE